MPVPESKIRSGIVLRSISPGGLKSCANRSIPCPPPKREILSAVDMRVPAEFLRILKTLTNAA